MCKSVGLIDIVYLYFTSHTTALLTANISLMPSSYNCDILAIYATNNRVLKEHRFISLIARRRRVCNFISKPVGRTQRWWRTRASSARHGSFNGRSVILALRFMSYHTISHNISRTFASLLSITLTSEWAMHVLYARDETCPWTGLASRHFVRPSLFRQGERLDR